MFQKNCNSLSGVSIPLVLQLIFPHKTCEQCVHNDFSHYQSIEMLVIIRLIIKVKMQIAVEEVWSNGGVDPKFPLSFICLQLTVFVSWSSSAILFHAKHCTQIIKPKEATSKWGCSGYFNKILWILNEGKIKEKLTSIKIWSKNPMETKYMHTGELTTVSWNRVSLTFYRRPSSNEKTESQSSHNMLSARLQYAQFYLIVLCVFVFCHGK